MTTKTLALCQPKPPFKLRPTPEFLKYDNGRLRTVVRTDDNGEPRVAEATPLIISAAVAETFFRQLKAFEGVEIGLMRHAWFSHCPHFSCGAEIERDEFDSWPREGYREPGIPYASEGIAVQVCLPMDLVYWCERYGKALLSAATVHEILFVQRTVVATAHRKPVPVGRQRLMMPLIASLRRIGDLLGPWRDAHKRRHGTVTS